MVVARASEMDLASILKRNTFLTLRVCPAGGRGPRGTGGGGGGRDGGTRGALGGAGRRGGTPPCRPRGGVPPYQQHQGGAPPHVGCQRNLSSKTPHRQRVGLIMLAFFY